MLCVETSLDTNYLAVAGSSNDTVATLKRTIVAVYPATFPNMGDIIVQAVKLHRKGVLFYLPDCTPLSALHNDGSILYVEAEADVVQKKSGKKSGKRYREDDSEKISTVVATGINIAGNKSKTVLQ